MNEPTTNSTNKSTNVRANNAPSGAKVRLVDGPRLSSVRLWAVRSGLRVLSWVSSRGASNLVLRWFATPPRARATGAIPAEAHEFEVSVPGAATIKGWRLGEGPPVILLHGWGGSAHQMKGFVPALRRRGLSVVSLDAPGHGRSSGRRSSLLLFTEALMAAVDHVQHKLGPVHGVIAHSLGGAASSLAISRGLALTRAVFVSPMTTPRIYFDAFMDFLAVPHTLRAKLPGWAEIQYGVRWADLDMAQHAATTAIPLLVIHDRDDRRIPVSESRLLAKRWPGARLMETQGLGHGRILKNAHVADSAVAFLAEGLPAFAMPEGNA